jgi:hypothetical protein
MAEKSDSKDDLKIVEFVKLLQRFGQSVIGLIILQIGWTTLLVLASKLGESSTGPPSVAGVSFGAIWVYGAVAIALGWSIYSRLYSYLVVPLVITAKPIVDFLFVLTVILGIGLDAVRNRLIERRRQNLIRQWVQNHRTRSIEKGKARTSEAMHTDQELNDAYEKWLTDFRREHGALEKVAEREIGLQKDTTMKLLAKVGRRLMTPLHTEIRVGLAPLSNYSSADTVVTLKPPGQQFGSAISNFVSHIYRMKNVQYIHFFLLPAHFPVRTHVQAGFAIRLFNLDTLIWGQFSEDQRNAYAQVLTSTDLSREKDKRDENGFHHNLACRFFPTEQVQDLSSVKFAPMSELDQHIVLVVAVLRSLLNYEQRRRLSKNDQKRRNPLVDGLKSAFTAYISTDEMAGEILEHLARDVLPMVKKGSTDSSVVPSAGAVAADMASRWVGNLLASDERYNSRWDREGTDRGRRRLAIQLHSVLLKCAELAPDRAIHFYRLGALSCFLGELDRARKEFSQAGDLDVVTDYSRGIPPFIDAQLEFESWAEDLSSGSKDELKFARFAANASAAIYAGYRDDIKRVIEGRNKPESAIWFNWDRLREEPSQSPLGLNLVNEMLGSSDTKASKRTRAPKGSSTTSRS